MTPGCGDDSVPTRPDTPETDPPPEGCAPPKRIVDGACFEPGVGDDGCPAGMVLDDVGVCMPPGMRADDCAEGFEHDGDVACEPILPADPCPKGLMALPGDEVCRPVMDCGDGTWGNIPVDAGTEYVDQSFEGTSDGSTSAPWKTISAAIAAADPGALVAIAAGSYVEEVIVADKPVRLYGVCPAEVEIVGSGMYVGGLTIMTGAGGTEVRGVAVRNANGGIAITDCQQVLLDRVWVHDTGANAGVLVDDAIGPAEATIVNSLIEDSTQLGVYVINGDAVIENTTVRGTVPFEESFGFGVYVIDGTTEAGSSSVQVRGSLLERNSGAGLYVTGSEATVEASVLRDTVAEAPGTAGRGYGLLVRSSEVTFEPAVVSVQSALIERNRELGVFVAGAELSLSATVVRDTWTNDGGEGGRGLNIQPEPNTFEGSLVTVSKSLFERNRGVGVFVGASLLNMDRSMVRDTLVNAGGRGHGIHTQGHEMSSTPTTFTGRGIVVERSVRLGVQVTNADADVTSMVVRDTFADSEDRFGDGVSVVHAVPEWGAATANLSTLLVEQSARAGISNFGGTISLDTSAIRCAAFELEGESLNEQPFTFDDLGGNGCGCPEADGECKVVSAGLEPPEAI
jgi:hypothetical protein